MRGKALFWLLVGLGAALLALAAGGLLLDIPASIGEARILRVNVLIGLLMLSAIIYFAAVRLVLSPGTVSSALARLRPRHPAAAG